MNSTMTKIAAGLALAAVATGAQAVTGTLTFVDGVGSTSFPSSANGSGFGAGMDFRMISPTGAIGGGGEKNTLFGGESWSLGATQLMGVSGTGTVGSAVGTTHCAAGGCPGIDQGALFFGPSFGFLAPYAGNASGLPVATVNWGGLSDGVADVGDTFSVAMPLAEAHWGGTYFPLANVTFAGTVTGASGAFSMTAEHLITSAEDPGGAGFSGWTAQWNYQGNVALAPVPEASTYGMMLAGLGLVGFAVRRRKMVA